ncbi:hypothetical protein BSLG_009889 [Batrachochytrium salamandrivorans]|nr:hypothetical protein BSLG_009889 [Batrachochytrium salamandrivorans]
MTTPPAHQPEAHRGGKHPQALELQQHLASASSSSRKYFANARTAEDPLMTDIDCAVGRMNMRISTTDPLRMLTRSKQAGADDRRSKDGLVLDYVSPGASLNEKEFTMPPPLHFYLCCNRMGYLIQHGICRYCTNNAGIVRGIIGGHQPCANLLFAIFIIHAIEAVATVAIGIWAEFTLSNILKWWFLTHIFGFATLGPVVRIAFRRRADLDARMIFSSLSISNNAGVL